MPVRFDARHNALVFHTQVLDRPLLQSEPDQMQLLWRRLHRMQREAQTREGGPIARVRDVIARNAMRAEFGANAAAQHLGMSLRAMQRMLRRHDLSLRTLLEDARRNRALELLRDEGLSLAEIAELLDYSNEGAFRRAFKRWKGESPSAHRRGQRAAAQTQHP